MDSLKIMINIYPHILITAVVFIAAVVFVYLTEKEIPNKELSDDEVTYLKGFDDGKINRPKKLNKESYLDGYLDGQKSNNDM